jgi:hypothetical protein
MGRSTTAGQIVADIGPSYGVALAIQRFLGSNQRVDAPIFAGLLVGHRGGAESIRSALWYVGCEGVIRIAGIHKIGTGGAQSTSILSTVFPIALRGSPA